LSWFDCDYGWNIRTRNPLFNEHLSTRKQILTANDCVSPNMNISKEMTKSIFRMQSDALLFVGLRD